MTLDDLRRRFAAAAPRSDSLYGDEGPRPDPGTLRPAAVLVPIVARAPAPTVILTQRASHLRDHSGQVSFPGGRVLPDDRSPEDTALREAEEEIGLARSRVELLGRLPEYHTRTGFRVTPVVSVVTPPFALAPDANEVEDVFEVPLAFLIDPANHQRHSREFQGQTRWFYAMPWPDPAAGTERYIWGATAAMLVNLYRHLGDG